MAGFGNGNNTPAQAPTQTPISTPIDRVTQEDLVEKLNSIASTPGVQGIIDKIEAFNLDPNNDHEGVIPQMQGLFAEIHDVNARDFSSRENAIWGYINQLEGLYNQYQDVKGRIEADSIEARDGFIPNDFLTQSDNILYRHIRDKLASAESWSTEDILEEAQGIGIESDNIGAEDWDEFFTDLRDEIPRGEVSNFDSFVTQFKNENASLYDGSYLDTELGVGIERMSGELDDILSVLGGLPDVLPEGQIIEIPVGGLETTFEGPNAKRAALLYVLKVKMVFAELANNQENILKNIFGFWVWGNSTVLSTSNSTWQELPTTGLSWIIPLLMTIAGLYAFNLTMFAPAESAFRGTKDFLIVRFGNNNISKLFDSIGNIGTGMQRISANTLRRLWVVGPVLHAPVGLLGSGIGVVGSFGTNMSQGIESAYLDQTISGVNYTVIDGVIGTEAGEFDKNEEAIKRVRVLEYYKNKWHFDAERLEKFESLRGKNGVIASRTETFWMRVWEIDQGQYIRTDRGATGRENALIRGENIGRQAIRTFTIPQFREEVLNDFNRNVNRSVKLLNVIFERVTAPTDGGSIEISDNRSQFYNEVSTYLDLNSSISNAEEILREGYLTELIDHIKQGRIQGTEVELKQEIVRIVKGFYPRFKTLKKLSLEIENSGDDSVKGRLMTFMDMVSKGKWTGTLAELDLAINEIENDTFNFNEKVVNIDQAEIERTLNKGRDLARHKFSETLTTADAFTDHFQREIESYSIRNNLDQSQRGSRTRELGKFFRDMKGRTIGDKTITVDYTHGQVNYVIQRILQGDTYDQASHSLTTETGNIEVDYDHDLILDREKRSLVGSMRTELEGIQSESDVTIKNEKFKEFKERYDLVLQDSGPMRNFAKGDNDFSAVLRLYTTINAEIGVGLQRFVTIEGNRIVGKAAELLDTAERMSPDKKAIITELRNKITLHTDPISIQQLENVLRPIIAGDIQLNDISTLDFNMYTDESRLTDEARDIRIIEARQVNIIDGETGSNRAINIIYTNDSQFNTIVSNWNNYTELRQKLEDFQENLRQQEILINRISAIDEEISGLRTRINRAPNQLIGVEPVNVEALERDITGLQTERTTTNESLNILKTRSGTMQISSRIRGMSLTEVSGYIETEDASFRSTLVSNKGFQDYLSKSTIDRSSHSSAQLWRDFIAYAQNNTVKSGGTISLDTIDKLTQNTPLFTGDELEVDETDPETIPKRGSDLLVGTTQYEADTEELRKRGINPDEYFRDILNAEYDSIEDAQRAINTKLINESYLIQGDNELYYWETSDGDTAEVETDPEARTTTGERLLFRENGELRNNGLGRAYQSILILMEIHPQGSNESLFDALRTQEFENAGGLVSEMNRLLTSGGYEGITMRSSVSEADLQITRKLQTLDMMVRVVYLTNYSDQNMISQFELDIWRSNNSEDLARIQGQIYGFLVQSGGVTDGEPIPSLRDIMSRNTSTLTSDQEAAIREINDYRTNTDNPTVSRLLGLFKRAMGR